jgi:hypothetical protein
MTEQNKGMRSSIEEMFNYILSENLPGIELKDLSLVPWQDELDKFPGLVMAKIPNSPAKKYTGIFILNTNVIHNV